MPTDRPAVCAPLTGVAGQPSTRPDLCDLARRHDDDLVSGCEAAGFDPARDDAAVIEFVDRLHRQPQRQRLQRPRRLKGVERLDHGRTAIPSDVGGAFGDAVAVAR